MRTPVSSIGFSWGAVLAGVVVALATQLYARHRVGAATIDPITPIRPPPRLTFGFGANQPVESLDRKLMYDVVGLRSIGMSGRCISHPDFIFDTLATPLRIEAFVAFGLGCLFRKFIILNRAAKPIRIIPSPQVVHPCKIIDAVRDLHETHEIICS